MCQEVGAKHKTVAIAVKFFHEHELRNEIKVFLREHKYPLSSLFTDEIWLCKLAYLADIFLKLNELNLLQGSDINI